MATFDIYNLEREKVGELELSDKVFNAPIKEHLFWEVVKWQLACRRAGTASTKRRGEVRGGGRKPYRQKGTGRARRGTIRAPHHVGGAVAHGPKPRDYSYTLPKKVRRQALCSALSLKAKEGLLVIVENFELPEIKTKKLVEIFDRFDMKKALVVDSADNKNLILSCRNLPTFHTLPPIGVNVYDVLKYDHLVLTKAAAKALEERLTRPLGKKEKLLSQQ